MTIYEIHEANIPRLEKKLTTIQKKCVKYGCPFEYKQIGEIFKKVENEILRFVVIEVSGTAQVNGWQFIGTIEHHAPMNLISTYAHDVEIPREYYTARSSCNHCQTNRTRHYTYIIQNVETGKFEQVGKACMKDYTKGLSAEAIAAWVSCFDSLIEFETPDTSASTPYFEVMEILQIAISVVDAFGYVKSKNELDEYNPNSTKNNVIDFLSDNEVFMKLAKKHNMTDPKTNTAQAEAIIDWALEQDEDYGYMTNLLAILRNKYCKSKHIGLIVSAVTAHRRAIEKTEREEKKRAESPSKYVGEVGERITFEVKALYCATSYPTAWGTTCIYKMTDEQGNVFVWKTSKILLHEEAHLMTGTVKAHSEYGGEKQTELTRCKVKAA